MRKKLTPIQRLMAAMDECAIARGEANWTNGYRTGRGGSAEHLYDKERAQWQKCDEVERSVVAEYYQRSFGKDLEDTGIRATRKN